MKQPWCSALVSGPVSLVELGQPLMALFQPISGVSPIAKDRSHSTAMRPLALFPVTRLLYLQHRDESRDRGINYLSAHDFPAVKVIRVLADATKSPPTPPWEPHLCDPRGVKNLTSAPRLREVIWGAESRTIPVGCQALPWPASISPVRLQ